MGELLRIENLEVLYNTEKGNVHAVNGINLTVNKGERVGLLGESGCGKSTVAKSIMGLLPHTAQVRGRITLNGHDLLTMPGDIRRRLNGKVTALAPQNAMSALDPVYTVKDQIGEILLNNNGSRNGNLDKTIYDLLELVSLDRKVAKSFPHQLSGGMRQRVLIAMALALKPQLVVADEPTTGLDNIIKAQILREIMTLQQELKFALLCISHDISVVSEISERVVIIYGGKIVEDCNIREFLSGPCHPYTLGLLHSLPEIAMDLPPVYMNDSPPTIYDSPSGCVFAARCPFSTAKCFDEEPHETQIKKDHQVHCHYTEKVEEFQELAKFQKTWDR